MKLASYNVENLFLRVRAMNLETLAEGREVLTMHAEMNRILSKSTYSANDKKRIVELMKALGIDKKDDGGKFAILRQNKGDLVKRPKTGGIQVVANGRGDWLGWLDLKREEVNEVATRNTAQVIRDVGADVMGVVEAENRPALVRFSDNVLPAVDAKPYGHIMLIDGNDDRGIDVAVLTRKNFDITSIRSYVDDEDNIGRIFSRDCAQYEITTPQGNTLIVLINHFKSKGFGSQQSSNDKRKRQAKKVKAIYKDLREKHDFVAVLGDLNDTPDSEPLAPLLKQTDLKDVSEHPAFENHGRPGTYANGTASNKIDYILLSPGLFSRMSRGEIFRMGVWGGKHGTLFPHYPEMTKLSEAASDHAAIWAEIDV